MTLFAVEDMTAFTVAMAAVTALGAFGSSYLNYRSGLARLNFDAERVTMQSALDYLKAEHADCERRQAELKVQVVSQGKEIDELRRRADKGDRRHNDDPDYAGPERRSDP